MRVEVDVRAFKRTSRGNDGRDSLCYTRVQEYMNEPSQYLNESDPKVLMVNKYINSYYPLTMCTFSSGLPVVDIVLFGLSYTFFLKVLKRVYPLEISQFTPLGDPTSSLAHYPVSSSDTICNSLKPTTSRYYSLWTFTSVLILFVTVSSPPLVDIILLELSLLGFSLSF